MIKFKLGSKVVVSLVEGATVFEVVEIDGFNVGLTYPVPVGDKMVNTVTRWVDKSFIRGVVEF